MCKCVILSAIQRSSKRAVGSSHISDETVDNVRSTGSRAILSRMGRYRRRGLTGVRPLAIFTEIHGRPGKLVTQKGALYSDDQGQGANYGDSGERRTTRSKTGCALRSILEGPRESCPAHRCNRAIGRPSASSSSRPPWLTVFERGSRGFPTFGWSFFPIL